MSSVAASWRVQDMPKREVASDVSVAGLRRVKYEKSSSALQDWSASVRRTWYYRVAHRCAPSANAINGMLGQSNSSAGSAPSSAPNQASISGPLRIAT